MPGTVVCGENLACCRTNFPLLIIFQSPTLSISNQLTPRDASPCCVCIPHYFISFDCRPPFLLLCFFSLCVAFIALALVFPPGLYSAAYRTACIAQLFDEDVFLSLRVSCGCLLFASYVFAFVCVFVDFLFIFILCLFCVPSWRRCPLLTTFLSVSFCLLSLLFSPNVFPV